jgi:phosphatidylinositol dimannoside acyltransferase
VTAPSNRFHVRAVFWRRFLVFAILNVPAWIEPVVSAVWAMLFLLWGPGRRGVMRNLQAIKPGSTAFINFFRSYRVFWNYAWTIGDTVRFRELGVMPDWEFVGWQHFETMQQSGGAILLTAHMGSYDLGAELFAETSSQRIIMVRAPEVDPQTHAFEETRKSDKVQIEFNVEAANLALDLLHAVRDGGVVAIQGDRITPGLSDLPATLFGRTTRLPAGPFALAMASQAPIHPMFIVRRGRRLYRLVACEPILVPTLRNREEAFSEAMASWTRELESVLRTSWYQWFMFEEMAT